LHSAATITGGTPATSGTTDPNVIARFQGGSVGFDLGGTAGGLQWIQPRSVNNYAANFGLSICPNGGNVGIGVTGPGEALSVSGKLWVADDFAEPSSTSDRGDITITNATGPADLLFLDRGLAATRMGVDTNDGGNFKFVTDKEFVFRRGGTSYSAFNTGSESARIDSSGRLLVGTSSARPVEPYANLTNGTDLQHVIEGTSTAAGLVICSNNSGYLVGATLTLAKTNGTTIGSNTIVANGDILGTIGFAGADGTDIRTKAGAIYCEVDGTPGANDMPGRLVFSTTADGASSPMERMRISNTGETYVIASSGVLSISSVAAAGTSVPLVAGRHTATIGTPGTGTLSVVIWSNGNVVNTNNSYGAISDIKLKENIVDASSQWDDLKSLQVRNYNFKEGQTHTQIGLIAQEVELVSPGLVSESPDRDAEGNDLGTVTKSVNYSVLYMKAVKALQEAMERIETLEAKVAALEAV
jgi:hypothetical protein